MRKVSFNFTLLIILLSSLVLVFHTVISPTKCSFAFFGFWKSHGNRSFGVSEEYLFLFFFSFQAMFS